jgi:hypothetical protein
MTEAYCFRGRGKTETVNPSWRVSKWSAGMPARQFFLHNNRLALKILRPQRADGRLPRQPT